MSASSSGEEKVTWVGYLAFVLTIVFFSGFFAKSTEWWRVLAFTVLNGSFGPVNGALTFRGEGGTGAKDGFLFALELAPSVILSLGIIAVTEGLGGLRAAIPGQLGLHTDACLVGSVLKAGQGGDAIGRGIPAAQSGADRVEHDAARYGT